MKGRFKPIMLLCDEEQKQDADDYPYLRKYGITGSSVGGLEVPMLFDRLKKISICHRSRERSAIDMASSEMFVPPKGTDSLTVVHLSKSYR